MTTNRSSLNSETGVGTGPAKGQLLPDPSPVVTITGFMGTGKTVTGRALAEILGLDFVDMDHYIQDQQGMSIPEIFAKSGEAGWRSLEARACHELEACSGLVLATGGGTLLDERNFDLLSRRGPVFLLEADPRTIRQRVGDATTRPLLAKEVEDVLERIEHLLVERAEAYGRIERRLDTTHLSPQAVAHRIASRLDLPTRVIEVKTPGRSRVEIGRGLLSRLGDRLIELGAPGGVFVLMPPTVRALYGEQIAASFEAASMNWTEISVDDGDRRKNWQQAGDLVDRLAEAGASRDSLAVAVGGGVTGDLVGFVASVYMRGMPLVQVPTTLLAQVDASIGGKVGVNSPHAKNLVGHFHWPHFVLSDPCVLRTLPDREISDGLAEVVKTAIIGAPALFERIEAAVQSSARDALHDPDFLEFCVRECAATKAGIVQRDPFESDERMLLNLGHTLGHALETATGYGDLTHGQAVSIGLVAAMKISVSRGILPAAILERTRAVLKGCGLPVDVPIAHTNAALGNLRLDKKIRAGRLRYVLPVELGMCKIVEDVTESEIKAACDL
jgi:3-dehydroquinate synthase